MEAANTCSPPPVVKQFGLVGILSLDTRGSQQHTDFDVVCYIQHNADTVRRMLENLTERAKAAPKQLWSIEVGKPFHDGHLFIEWGKLFTDVPQYAVTISIDWDKYLEPVTANSVKRVIHTKRRRLLRERIGKSWEWQVYGEPVESEMRRWFTEHTAELLELCVDPAAVEQAAWKSAKITKTGNHNWRNERHESWTIRGEVPLADDDDLIKQLLEQGATVKDNVMDAPVPDHRHRAGRQFTDGKAFALDLGWGELSYVPHGSVSASFTRAHRWTATITIDQWEAVRNSFSLPVYQIEELRTLPNGRVIPVGDVRGKDRYRQPSKQELQKAGYSFAKNHDGWAYRGDVQLAEALNKISDWTPDEDLTVTWTTAKDDTKGLRRAALWQLSRAAAKAEWPKAARGLIDHCEFSSESTTLLVREHLPHEGPPSERGVLRIRHADPEPAFQWMLEAGVIEHCEVPEVPTGRRLPQLDVYENGEKELPRLPEHNMIIHGLTGAANDSEMIQRLNMIISSGGLKSLAERRRLGLTLSSLDQHGDTASSMDLGVPATITASPWAGSGIFFVMHPRIMGRRDMWMMNGCPGGTGREQKNAYMAYAESIGASLGSPPPHKSRIKHLKTGLTQYNEIYFKYEIPNHDIMALMVTTKNGLHQKVKAMADEWRVAGVADLMVIPFSDQGNAGNFGVLPGPNQSVGLKSAIAGLWNQCYATPDVEVLA